MSLQTKDVMQSKVHTVSPTLSLPDLECAFLDARVGAFPVVEEDRLVGLVSRSDIVRQIVAETSYAGVLADFYTDLSGFGSSEEDEDRKSGLQDLARQAAARVEGLTVRDVMSTSLVTVSPEDPVRDVARLLIDRGIHRVPVTEGEKLVGILSTLDLVRLFAEEEPTSR